MICIGLGAHIIMIAGDRRKVKICKNLPFWFGHSRGLDIRMDVQVVCASMDVLCVMVPVVVQQSWMGISHKWYVMSSERTL